MNPRDELARTPTRVEPLNEFNYSYVERFAKETDSAARETTPGIYEWED